MTSLDSFPLFPNLIPELRMHIWHHALLNPRLVVIWKHEKRGINYLRRSSSSPLLSVNTECRHEALSYYACPITGPCVLPLLPSLSPPQLPNRLNPHPSHPTQIQIQSSTNPHYIGPGTDILYIKGLDSPAQRYKPVSWTCITLSRDLESLTPTLSPIRRLAVDAEFLRSTPLYQFAKMPYSVWKLVVSDLRQLEELFVVTDHGSREEHAGGDSEGDIGGASRKGREKEFVEAKLKEAKGGYRGYMECVWADEAGELEIEGWCLPVVTEVTFDELVGRCWTSWE